ncbi:MAG: hypothetical protein KF857_03075 [Fimbriimonadaceae bacterium]|nr:hypothetical protein [Fimbriimonadaceae bacterium]
MTLRTTLRRLVEIVRETCPGEPAYVSVQQGRTVVSVARRDTDTVVLAYADGGVTATKAYLKQEGVEAHDGAWFADGMPQDMGTRVWIGAVSYRSDEPKPGLWVDAFPVRPSAGDVLEAMYAEFQDEGLVPEGKLDAFLAQVEPNVVILEPDEIEGMLVRHTVTAQPREASPRELD